MSDWIPAVSALVGALVGGSATYLVARQQIKAHADSEQERRRREDIQRRRELYADFVAAATNVFESFQDAGGSSSSDAELQELADARARRDEALNGLSARVRITASSGVVEAAENVLDVLRRARRRDPTPRAGPLRCLNDIWRKRSPRHVTTSSGRFAISARHARRLLGPAG